MLTRHHFFHRAVLIPVGLHHQSSHPFPNYPLPYSFGVAITRRRRCGGLVERTTLARARTARQAPKQRSQAVLCCMPAAAAGKERSTHGTARTLRASGLFFGRSRTPAEIQEFPGPQQRQRAGVESRFPHHSFLWASGGRAARGREWRGRRFAWSTGWLAVRGVACRGPRALGGDAADSRAGCSQHATEPFPFPRPHGGNERAMGEPRGQSSFFDRTCSSVRACLC